MATYVIGDIHNSSSHLEGILEQISPTIQDHVYLLGDLFDRGEADPDPVGVYFKLSSLNATVTWIRGNHDQLLADYIYRYFHTSEKKREYLQPYRYNSFELMYGRLVEMDLLNLADLIMKLPLQVELEIASQKYLLAHAMTFEPSNGVQSAKAYLEGWGAMQDYWDNGVNGYISLVGHHDSSYQYRNPKGSYLDEKSSSIWRNERKNLYMMECGCGLPGGRLACICLETGGRFYS